MCRFKDFNWKYWHIFSLSMDRSLKWIFDWSEVKYSIWSQICDLNRNIPAILNETCYLSEIFDLKRIFRLNLSENMFSEAIFLFDLKRNTRSKEKYSCDLKWNLPSEEKSYHPQTAVAPTNFSFLASMPPPPSEWCHCYKMYYI